MCLDDFPNSKSRPAIMAGLEHLLGSLTSVEVEAELWVNGSFLTLKTDPGDVDVVLRVADEFLVSATTAQKAAISRIVDEHDMLKASYFCDAYVFREYPAGHPQYAAGQLLRKHWEEMWGRDRRRSPKGFAVLTLAGGANV